jgi:hypothetical protein
LLLVQGALPQALQYKQQELDHTLLIAALLQWVVALGQGHGQTTEQVEHPVAVGHKFTEIVLVANPDIQEHQVKEIVEMPETRAELAVVLLLLQLGELEDSV